MFYFLVLLSKLLKKYVLFFSFIIEVAEKKYVLFFSLFFKVSEKPCYCELIFETVFSVF